MAIIEKVLLVTAALWQVIEAETPPMVTAVAVKSSASRVVTRTTR